MRFCFYDLYNLTKLLICRITTQRIFEGGICNITIQKTEGFAIVTLFYYFAFLCLICVPAESGIVFCSILENVIWIFPPWHEIFYMTSIRRITLWGMALNTLLTAFKFLVGILCHSQACIADAVHSLSDFLTDIVVLVGERFWSAPADGDHPHGHQRIEAMITAFIGLLLAFTAISLCVNAIRLMAAIMMAEGDGMTPPSVPGWSVLVVAVASILTKEILYQWTAWVGHATHSTAVVANAWHHRSDAISSIPVVVVALAGRLWPSITFLDPVAAVLVSCMLLRTAWHITWPCLQELSDQGVGRAQLESMRQIAASIPGIKDVHKLRTRRVGHGILLDLHVLVDKNMTVEDGHRLCEQASALIRKKMPRVLDVLTHLEPENSTNLETQIAALAKTVEGVKDVHGIRVRNTLSGYDADLHVLVEATMSVSQGHAICTQVQELLLSSPLKIVSVLTHLEPY